MSVDLDILAAPEDKVFVANFNEKNNYDSAHKYGQVIYITSGFLDLRDMERHRVRFEGMLAQAQPTDYVILNGPAVINTIMLLIWITRFGYVNLLSWDHFVKAYVPHSLGLSVPFREFLDKSSPKIHLLGQ